MPSPTLHPDRPERPCSFRSFAPTFKSAACGVGVSPLTSTLTKNSPATPLASTLKSIVNSKSRRINTYEKVGGRGVVVLLALRHDGTEQREPKDPSELDKAFRLIRLRKNESANHFVSHGSKTKDLKPHRITRLQKKGGGGLIPLDAGLQSPAIPPAFNCRLSTVDANFTSHQVTDHQSRTTSH